MYYTYNVEYKQCVVHITFVSSRCAAFPEAALDLDFTTRRTRMTHCFGAVFSTPPRLSPRPKILCYAVLSNIHYTIELCRKITNKHFLFIHLYDRENKHLITSGSFDLLSFNCLVSRLLFKIF